MSYAVFFDKDELTVRLPVNPESIAISKAQSIENYNVLKFGQVAIQNGVELDKYSFEAEFPGKPYGYILTSGDFKPAQDYLQIFEYWRRSNEPVRLIIINGEGGYISTPVLIESLDISENAGEEGDYSIAFKLTEYREFGMMEVFIVPSSDPGTQKANIAKPARAGSPQKPNAYTVVRGDTLWGIAKRYLGNGARYPELVKANPEIKNPSLIRVGQVIKIP